MEKIKLEADKKERTGTPLPFLLINMPFWPATSPWSLIDVMGLFVLRKLLDGPAKKCEKMNKRNMM